MPTSPAISVVVPTYNRKALVLEAVASVVAQTLDDFELIVVDDGSTDGTQEAVEAAFGEDPRLRYVAKENGGTASARNRGVAEARAPLLAFLDSDDFWRPRYLESQRAVLEREGADMVLCDVAYLGVHGRGADSMFADPTFTAPTSPASLFDGGWGLPSAELIRTEIVRALPLRSDYPCSEDSEFLFRFHAAGHTCVLNDERLAVWRHHDGGEGVAQKTDHTEAFEDERMRMFEEYRHMAPDPDAVDAQLYALHRNRAKQLVAEGRFRAARPHVRAWWRKRPTKLRLAWYYLRGFLPGAGS